MREISDSAPACPGLEPMTDIGPIREVTPTYIPVPSVAVAVGSGFPEPSQPESPADKVCPLVIRALLNEVVVCRSTAGESGAGSSIVRRGVVYARPWILSFRQGR